MATRRFCSRRCYLASVAAARITKVCPVCGRDFTVIAKWQDRYTVCSVKCRRHMTTYRPCPICGKQFNDKRGVRRYCSEPCRRPAVIVNCRTCGKRFRKGPQSKVQFCCLACWRRYRGETQLEAAIRLALAGLNCRTRWRVVPEAKLGRYSIDFLLPQIRVALEVDGTYWHRDPARDRRKDKWLLHHDWYVIRIPEAVVRAKGADTAVRLALELFIPETPSRLRTGTPDAGGES